MTQNEIHAIVGRKGTGKTTLAMNLAKYSDLSNILWYDTIHEFATRKIKEALPGFSKVKGLSSLRSALLGPLQLVHRVWGGQWPGFLLVYEPGPGGSTRELYAVYALLRNRYKRTRQPATLIVDELALLNGGRTTPQKAIYEMVREGRHIELDQIYIAQRPRDLTTDVMSQADHWWILRSSLSNDLERLEKEGIPHKVAEVIAKLKTGQSIHYDVRTDRGELVEGHE